MRPALASEPRRMSADSGPEISRKLWLESVLRREGRRRARNGEKSAPKSAAHHDLAQQRQRRKLWRRVFFDEK